MDEKKIKIKCHDTSIFSNLAIIMELIDLCLDNRSFYNNNATLSTLYLSSWQTMNIVMYKSSLYIFKIICNSLKSKNDFCAPKSCSSVCTNPPRTRYQMNKNPNGNCYQNILIDFQASTLTNWSNMILYYLFIY